MAQSLCTFEPIETFAPHSLDRHDGADEGRRPQETARWGMGLVTAVTLVGFSTLAATTAIAWSLASF